MQISVVRNRSTAESTNTGIADLLSQGPQSDQLTDFASEQHRDPDVVKIINFLEDGILPSDDRQAKKLALQGSQFVLVDNILYYIDPNGKKRAVVPKQLQKGILEENHSGGMAGHFAVSHLYAALSRSWWWE